MSLGKTTFETAWWRCWWSTSCILGPDCQNCQARSCYELDSRRYLGSPANPIFVSVTFVHLDSKSEGQASNEWTVIGLNVLLRRSKFAARVAPKLLHEFGPECPRLGKAHASNVANVGIAHCLVRLATVENWGTTPSLPEEGNCAYPRLPGLSGAWKPQSLVTFCIEISSDRVAEIVGWRRRKIPDFPALSKMSDQDKVQGSSAGTKRKRSVIACGSCHDRKVRCNVALQGVPCSNCVQDGSRCEIYRRKIGM